MEKKISKEMSKRELYQQFLETVQGYPDDIVEYYVHQHTNVYGFKPCAACFEMIQINQEPIDNMDANSDPDGTYCGKCDKYYCEDCLYRERKYGSKYDFQSHYVKECDFCKGLRVNKFSEYE